MKARRGFPVAMRTAAIGLVLLTACDSPPASLERPREEVYDFGPVLARGQTLRHVFTLRNETGRKIAIRRLEVASDFPAGVGAAAREIAARASAGFESRLRVPPEGGQVFARFRVETGEPDPRVDRYVLRATGIPRVEMNVEGPSMPTVAVGEPGSVSLLLRLRRTLGEPTCAGSARIEGSDGLEARFLDEGSEEVSPVGLVETVRRAECVLPASVEAGERRGEVRVEWPAGRVWKHTVAWRVMPALVVEPSTVVVRTGGDLVIRDHTVRVWSRDGRPFRVLSVDGAAETGPLPGLPTAAGASHELRLPREALRGDGAAMFDLEVRTDHPYQPGARITVVRYGE